MRRVARERHRPDPTDRSDPPGAATYARWLNHADSAIVANATICLIHQTNYLLDQQIRALERDFIQEGGYSEQLAVARIKHQQAQNQNRSDHSDWPDRTNHPGDGGPVCLLCARPLVLRNARKGPQAGSQFWGCSTYPQCKSSQPLDSP